MHIRTQKKVGQQNLHFYTSAIKQSELSQLSIHPHSLPANQIEAAIQEQINQAVLEGKQISIFPEGPYCSLILD
jgi:hypothetical protein